MVSRYATRDDQLRPRTGEQFSLCCNMRYSPFPAADVFNLFEEFFAKHSDGQCRSTLGIGRLTATV